MRHKFTQSECSKGGKATAAITGSFVCKRCGDTFTRHIEHAGHLGLHTFADRYTGGDMHQALEAFQQLGAAATDPFPENGAFARGHQLQALIKEANDRALREAAFAEFEARTGIDVSPNKPRWQR